MTADEIAALRQLYEAGTRGEWECVMPNPPELWDARIFAVNNTRFIGMIGNSDNAGGCDSANAVLIAAMHNALPELLKMAEWCVGRCNTCGLISDCPKGHFKGTELWKEAGPCNMWSPVWAKGE